MVLFRQNWSKWTAGGVLHGEEAERCPVVVFVELAARICLLTLVRLEGLRCTPFDNLFDVTRLFQLFQLLL